MEQNAFGDIAGNLSAVVAGSLPMLVGYLFMLAFVVMIAWPLYRMWRR